MVLTGDADAPAVQVFDRVVGTVVALLHFEGLGTCGQSHDLVTQTNAKSGNAAFNQFAHGVDGVIARLRVSRAVGQKDAIGLELQSLLSRGLRRYDGDARTALGQHAQDVFLHTKVVGNNMEAGRSLDAVTRAQFPLGLRPFICFFDGHDFRQVKSGHAGRSFSQRNSLVDDCLQYNFARTKGHDAAVLRAFVAQMACQLAGVNVGNRHGTFFDQIFRQSHGHAKAGRQQRQVFDDQTGSANFFRLHIFSVDAVVTDVWVR